jgi:hypothetical protein
MALGMLAGAVDTAGGGVVVGVVAGAGVGAVAVRLEFVAPLAVAFSFAGEHSILIEKEMHHDH